MSHGCVFLISTCSNVDIFTLSDQPFASIGSFKAILPIRNPVWGHLTVSTEILVSAGKSCFSFALSMINASAPHQVGIFRHFALLITQQYDSATSSFAIARRSCRLNEYAAVVPFGWPLML